MKYTIFHHTLISDINVPELIEEALYPDSIFFHSQNNFDIASDLTQSPINWNHHWRLPNGEPSISVGTRKGDYWIQFRKLAYFQLNITSNHITCYREHNIPDETIRHLLLDQVIPRLLSHQGQLILHASCVMYKQRGIVFCGESGFGKSTLASFFHSKGHELITDDCLLLNRASNKLLAIANYKGLRLFPDSISILPKLGDAKQVSHYGSKKRIFLSKSKAISSIPIQTIFILTNPDLLPTNKKITITRLSGASKAIELVKNNFVLDVTDTKRMGSQLFNCAQIATVPDVSLCKLSYPRELSAMPTLLSAIHRYLNK